MVGPVRRIGHLLSGLPSPAATTEEREKTLVKTRLSQQHLMYCHIPEVLVYIQGHANYIQCILFLLEYIYKRSLFICLVFYKLPG